MPYKLIAIHKTKKEATSEAISYARNGYATKITNKKGYYHVYFQPKQTKKHK
jgi:hypothetical protein